MENMKVKVSEYYDKNFLGTYLTENGSTAVVVSRSAMVVKGKKQIIWVGFIIGQPAYPNFQVWDKEGKILNRSGDKMPIWNLKEAVREQPY